MEQLGDKLKSLRKAMKLSLVELAERAECSPSYLSMVENDKVDPSISRLKRIAEELGATINDLFRDESHKDVVIKKNERTRVAFPRSKMEAEILVPDITGKQIDARLILIHPGGSSDGFYKHEGEEFGLVLEGHLEIIINGTTYKLQDGDSFYFNSQKNHGFKNSSNGETVVLWVNQPPKS